MQVICDVGLEIFEWRIAEPPATALTEYEASIAREPAPHVLYSAARP
jgi:hypothetical protein